MTDPWDLVIPDAAESQVAAVVTVAGLLRPLNNTDAAGRPGRECPGAAGEIGRDLRAGGGLIHGDLSYSKES